MNANEQQRHADALLRSGRHFAAPKRDGSGNVTRLEPIPWSQALVEIMRVKGWVLCEDTPQPAQDPRKLVLIPKEGD